ncbi:MAG: type II toxin-antitoxin system RelE/ParE family toxin [Planctomycetota bacterium]
MVERGPADVRKGRTISSKEMGRRIRAWQKSCGPKRPSAWLEDIYRYIARDDPDAAAQVIEGIYSKVQALAKFPEIGYR